MAPLKLALLFCTVKAPPLGPQLTVPALVSASAKYSLPLPLTFITPLLAMVKGPPAVPPLQLTTAPSSTFKLPGKVAPAQLKVPLTVLLPVRVTAPRVRLVIVPP